ncbi:MAG: integrase core domain-containing protein [Marinobacter sp.]|nr:integrase core domain-containing protein [Marinobacter sp.]
MAIIDINSRYVVNWSLSNTMEAEWCAGVLREAIENNGRPGILNTDQGSQFTSDVFKEAVLENDIKFSMDGKGRATDNAFIERLWRSVKYEKVYLYPTSKPMEMAALLREYFDYYNNGRRHSSIGDQKPYQVYYKDKETNPAKQAA